MSFRIGKGEISLIHFMLTQAPSTPYSPGIPRIVRFSCIRADSIQIEYPGFGRSQLLAQPR